MRGRNLARLDGDARIDTKPGPLPYQLTFSGTGKLPMRFYNVRDRTRTLYLSTECQREFDMWHAAAGNRWPTGYSIP